MSHAFASALAPVDEYNKDRIQAAMTELGLVSDNLACVYCASPAETWDHLVNLVKAGELNGYGHQLGNLVPCCRHCNSKKGSKSYEVFIDAMQGLDERRKSALKQKLSAHLQLSKPTTFEHASGRSRELLDEIDAIKRSIIGLMGDADKKIQELREETKACKQK